MSSWFRWHLFLHMPFGDGSPSPLTRGVRILGNSAVIVFQWSHPSFFCSGITHPGTITRASFICNGKHNIFHRPHAFSSALEALHNSGLAVTIDCERMTQWPNTPHPGSKPPLKENWITAIFWGYVKLAVFILMQDVAWHLLYETSLLWKLSQS